MGNEARVRARNSNSAWNQINTLSVKTTENYPLGPDSYVVTWEAVVNGKKRDFVSYKCYTEGEALRHLHRKFQTFLNNSYEQSDASFAYKRDSNIQACVSRHMNTDVFLKTDIHSFFTTIKKDRMKEKLEALILKKYKGLIGKIVDCCYYDDKMPLGFITSPVLSDMYLSELDACFADRSDIVYTRYADDFIISTSGVDAEARLQGVLIELRERLLALGLELNTKKTYIRRLSKPGDAIHVLGLNIVKTDSNVNRITVSDRFIRKTSIDFCDLIHKNHSLSQEEMRKSFISVFGRIQFIKNSSSSSEKKLKKMLSVKLDREISLDHHDLFSILMGQGRE